MALTLESDRSSSSPSCLSVFVSLSLTHAHTCACTHQKPGLQSFTCTYPGTHRGCVTGMMGSGLLLAWGASSSRVDMELREPTTEMAWPWADRRRLIRTLSGFTTFSSLGSSLHCLVCSTPEGEVANGLQEHHTPLLPSRDLLCAGLYSKPCTHKAHLNLQNSILKQAHFLSPLCI